MTLRWSIGITTVPERRCTLLPRTMNSLKAAGFEKPWIFMDGEFLPFLEHDDVCHNASCRTEWIGAWSNWHLSLVELHARKPLASGYMLVQDDVVFSKNVRQYLDKTLEGRLQDKKEWYNLYTVNQNEQIIAGNPVGWHESALLVGGGLQTQVHQGALALIFSVAAVEALLSHPSIINKCRSPRPTTNIDGTVGRAMNAMGWREMVHNPSLVDHIGADCSVIDEQVDAEVKSKKREHVRAALPKCQSFRGEDFNALNLL